MIFDIFVKMRESLYNWTIIWINIILNHIDTRTFLPSRYEDSCIVYRPGWYQKKKYRQITHRNCEILVMDTRMV